MKSNDIKSILRFILILSSLLIFTFLMHNHFLISASLNEVSRKAPLIQTYTFNGLFTALAYTILTLLRHTRMNILGFIFLAGSTVKLLMFLVLFRPGYMEDSTVSTEEFLEFFVPYGICLFLEVLFIAKILNPTEIQTEK